MEILYAGGVLIPFAFYFMMQALQRADEIEKLVENVGEQVCWILLFHTTPCYYRFSIAVPKFSVSVGFGITLD